MSDLKGSHAVTLGRTFTNTTTTTSTAPSFHAFKYNFQPGTLDHGRAATLTGGSPRDAHGEYVLSVPTRDGGPPHTFRGPQVQQKEVDCLLIYDEESGSYRLERLDSVLRLDHQRQSAQQQAQTSAGHVAAAAAAAAVPPPPAPAVTTETTTTTVKRSPTMTQPRAAKRHKKSDSSSSLLQIPSGAGSSEDPSHRRTTGGSGGDDNDDRPSSASPPSARPLHTQDRIDRRRGVTRSSRPAEVAAVVSEATDSSSRLDGKVVHHHHHHDDDDDDDDDDHDMDEDEDDEDLDDLAHLLESTLEESSAQSAVTMPAPVARRVPIDLTRIASREDESSEDED